MSTKLKPTLTKKNPTLKAGALEPRKTYDDQFELTHKIRNHEQMSDDITDQLIIDTNRLTKEDHQRLYAMLRTFGIEQSFFAQSKNSTHFQITKVPNNIKWRVYMYVDMAKKDQKRREVLKAATQSHQDQITNLNGKLNHDNNTSESFDTQGQTEQEKMRKLIELNKIP